MAEIDGGPGAGDAEASNDDAWYLANNFGGHVNEWARQRLADMRAEVADLRGKLFDTDSAYRDAMSALDRLAEDWHSPIWETPDGREFRQRLAELAGRMEQRHASPLRGMFDKLIAGNQVLRAEIGGLWEKFGRLEECYRDRERDLEHEYQRAEAAEAEIERLKLEREQMAADLRLEAGHANYANDEAAKLVAEVERLRNELAKFDTPYYLRLEECNSELQSRVDRKQGELWQARSWSSAWKQAAKRYRKTLSAYDKICDEGAKREIAERSKRLQLQAENERLREDVAKKRAWAAAWKQAAKNWRATAGDLDTAHCLKLDQETVSALAALVRQADALAKVIEGRVRGRA